MKIIKVQLIVIMRMIANRIKINKSWEMRVMKVKLRMNLSKIKIKINKLLKDPFNQDNRKVS
jgi:hypothetical protein